VRRPLLGVKGEQEARTDQISAGQRCGRTSSKLKNVSGVGQLSGVAQECSDPAALAESYSRLTGWPVVYAHADWYSVGESEKAGFHLSFQRAPGHQPPPWPDPASSMQLHLHFRVNDLDAAERAVLALGGTKFDDQPGPDRSRVFADRQVIHSVLCREGCARGRASSS
jgi:hypothetical protein